MLKRQRPSSPPPPAAEALLAAEPSVDLDISERVAKRTRHFAPLRRSCVQKGDVVVGSDTDGEEDQVEEGWSEYSRGQTEWQEQAGLYKTANTLLHDLHAEQRHRQLFSAKPSTSSPHQQDTRYPASSYPNSLPGLASLPRDVAVPHRDAPSSETSRRTQSTPRDGFKVQTVSSQYEDANRFANAHPRSLPISAKLASIHRILKDLFLNRRRRADDGPI